MAPRLRAGQGHARCLVHAAARLGQPILYTPMTMLKPPQDTSSKTGSGKRPERDEVVHNLNFYCECYLLLLVSERESELPIYSAEFIFTLSCQKY